MESFVLLPKENLDEVLSKIEKIQEDLNNNYLRKSLFDEWLTGEDVKKNLHISSRTLQNYRDKRVLPYSQHGSKILYRAEDIEVFLNNNYVKSRRF